LGNGDSLSGNPEKEKEILELKEQVLDSYFSMEERLEHLEKLFNLGYIRTLRSRVRNTLLDIGNEDSGAPLVLRKKALRFADLLQYLWF
jgi:vacuolar-type H+-ATPase subunit E/Vma4